jgi:hypothetical protein
MDKDCERIGLCSASAPKKIRHHPAQDRRVNTKDIRLDASAKAEKPNGVARAAKAITAKSQKPKDTQQR